MSIPVPHLAFDELISFLAASPSAEEIVAYQPPKTLQARMSALLDKNRQDKLSAEEEAELDEFLRMNRFMSRLQAKARQNLTGS